MSRPSNCDLLPAEIREQLNQMVEDPAITNVEARKRINSILEQMGRSERLSASSVNRYALRMEEIGAKMREARQVADAWIVHLGTEPSGEVGKLLSQMVRYLAFESTMNFAEGDPAMQPKMLKDLAIAIERLERAASQRAKREEEIREAERKRIKEELDKNVDEAVRQQGLNADQAQFWREQVLGIK